MANEQLSFQIAALYTGQPAIKAAFDDFAKLNAQGAKVTSELNRLGNQVQKTGEQIRNSRQGTAQLGMQFNQLATQVASGTSPLLALQQQLGDVGYAMTFMSGTAGRIGSFLAGPWGAAIIAGTAVLAPYIAKLFEAATANNSLGDAIARVQALQGKSAAAQLAEAQINQNKAREKLLVAETDFENRMRNMPGVRHYKQEQAVYSLRQEVLVTGEEVRILQEKLDELNKPVKTPKTKEGGRTRSAGVSSAQREMERFEERQRKATEEFNAMRLQGTKKFQDEMDTLNQESLMDYEAFQTGMEVIAARAAINIENEITKPYEEMKKAMESVGMSVDDAFKNMLLAGGSWRDGMKSIIQSVIDQLWKMYVTQQIVGMVTGAISGLFGGGGGGSNITVGNMSSGVQLPAFANGTTNAPGGMAWVGERGPELVNLPRGSKVIPSHRAQGMGGGINITVDARGSADPAAVRAQVQQGILEAAPAIIAAAQQRTVTNLRRPKLGGAIQ